MSEHRSQQAANRGYEPELVVPRIEPRPVGEYWISGTTNEENIALGAMAARIRDHKGMLALFALAGLVLGLMVASTSTRVYRAHTTLQLEGFHETPLTLPAAGVSGVPGASVDNYLQNQVKLLQSETLARRVAAKLPPAEAPKETWRSRTIEKIRGALYAGSTSSPEQRRVQAVRDAMKIQTSLQSQVIELTYDATSPEEATAGANLAAAEFIALNREAREEMIAESTDWLARQALELKNKVEAARQGLQAYANSAGLIFAGADDTLAQARMRQLQQALVQAEADRAAKQSRFQTASNSGRLEPTTADPLQPFQTDLQSLRKELSQLRTIYTANHPKLVAVEAQIQEGERALEAARGEIVSRLQSEYLAAQGLERMLQDSQDRELRLSERQMSQQRHYEVMKAEADTTQHLYQQVLENLQQAGAASSLRSANVRVIDPAYPPTAPYRPNLPLNASIGMGTGALAGLALVLLRTRSLRVARPGDTTALGAPELGAIPSAIHPWLEAGPNHLLPFRRKQEPGLVTWTQDSSPLSETYRSTLNSILFGPPLSRERGQVLTITSFDPMAGKTTVAANLAVASAERKLRVLVIDADLRRPRIHSLFNLGNDWGLSNVLEQGQVSDHVHTAPLESLVKPTHIPNVWVLPSGPGNAAIPSLLYSVGLRALLQRFRKEFDLIYVDSPPMMLYSDARLLGHLSDGVVMVVRANTRGLDELRMVYGRLAEDRIRVVGTILNGWETSKHEGRQYGSYYYRYQSPAAKAS